jgi:hypothetical protein
VTAAYVGPFQKQYCNCSEDSLMIATMECRNMKEEILCICHVCIPVHIRLVLYVDFHTTHGTRNIKIMLEKSFLFVVTFTFSITGGMICETLKGFAMYSF